MDKFRSWVRDLHRKFPPLLPVRVYRRPISAKDGEIGQCWLVLDSRGRPKSFVIVVEERMGWQATWQVLLHEWAHALSWKIGEGHETVCDHDAEWGLALSRIYQEMQEP